MSVKPVAIRRCPRASSSRSPAAAARWPRTSGKTKDDALESLLKELDEPEKAAPKIGQAGQGRRNRRPAAADGEEAPTPSSPPPRPARRRRTKTGQAGRSQVARCGQGVPQGSSARRAAGETGRDQGRAGSRRSSPKSRPRRRDATAAARGARKPAPTSWGAKTRTSTSGSRS